MGIRNLSTRSASVSPRKVGGDPLPFHLKGILGGDPGRGLMTLRPFLDAYRVRKSDRGKPDQVLEP